MDYARSSPHNFFIRSFGIYVILPGYDKSYIGLVSSPYSHQEAGLANVAATVHACHNGDWARSSRIIDATYSSVCIRVGYDPISPDIPVISPRASRLSFLQVVFTL
jgi:hypothetical protein